MATYLITGGAGFVGSNLALAIAREMSGSRVVALDNLHRNGSQHTLARLKQGGVEFVHGDVRIESDLEAVGKVDFIIECSAEPSVQAGVSGGLDFLLQTNLNGALLCAKKCLRDGAGMLFLSSSRIYPIQPLLDCCYTEAETRLVLSDEQEVAGLSASGVAEDFPVVGERSLYGGTKFAAEVMLAEFCGSLGVPMIINRCGVIAGPWQFGRVDQGVAALWVKAHLLGKSLSYIGFGGTGKQVRDFLHVDDLADLVLDQLRRSEHYSGYTFNVGGGLQTSASLLELSDLCHEATGTQLEYGRIHETRYADIPIYISNCRAIAAHAGWTPKRDMATIVDDIARWLQDNPACLELG